MLSDLGFNEAEAANYKTCLHVLVVSRLKCREQAVGYNLHTAAHN